MRFHVNLYPVKCQLRLNFARKSSITLLGILLMCLSVSLAQPLQIRYEAAFGGPETDFGQHNVLINSKGEVVVFGVRGSDSTRVDDFQVTIFDRQLRKLSEWSLPYENVAFRPADIIETADGGYIMIGNLERISNFPDPDPVPEIQITKISSAGVLQWDRKFGAGTEHGVGIQQTADGGYLVISNTSPLDLNSYNPTGMRQVLLSKLDPGGNTSWTKLMTSVNANAATHFTKTSDGNFVICGITTDTENFGNNASRGDALLMKFNDQGIVLWHRNIGGNSDDEGFEKISVDRTGAILVAGYTRSTNLNGVQNHGGSDGWITKVSNEGDIISMQLIGGAADDWFSAIAVSASGLVTAGGITLSSDGDLVANVNKYTIWATTFQDGYINLRHGFFGHDALSSSAIEDIAIDANSNIYCVANSSPVNTFMRKPLGLADGWVFNIAEPNVVKTSVFVDLNNNGAKDGNEGSFHGGKLEIIKINDPAYREIYSSRNGEFIASIDTGAFTVRFTTDQPYYTILPSEHSVVFSAFNMTDSFSVRLVPLGVKNDLAVSITPLNIARPGFEAAYMLTVVNRGNATANSPVIRLLKDPRLEIASAVPAISSIAQDTILWNAGSLQPLDTVHIRLNGRISAPPTTTIGDTLISVLSVQGDSGDETPLDNLIALSEVLAGSYDPNDKTEFHAGVFPVNLLASDKLHYVIRFQNTGNDTAFNIVIRDTLDSNIDISGFQMLAASHPYKYTIRNGNQLEWSFENILLVDSNRNEKASHGFIGFSVKPKSSLVVGEVITNKASIYFDYNLPIVTNTSSTTIVEPALALPTPVATGLKTTYCGNDQVQVIKISNISAAGGATISVKLNGNLVSLDNNSGFSIDPTKLLTGNQNLEITFTKGTTSSRLNARFIVTAPVKPVVKLSSNVAVVNNSTTALQLTATAMAGSGNAPVFTFSTDRGISGILQTDSNSHTLNVTSQILNVGDNWIYVRMKSSETCITSATAIDSIKIVRNAVTAIVDVDFSTSIITAFPNPFKSELTIKGLQASGSYTIQLISASGNLVKTQDAERRTSLTFYNIDVNKGIYFIRLYDKKKKRRVGSMPVIGL